MTDLADKLAAWRKTLGLVIGRDTSDRARIEQVLRDRADVCGDVVAGQGDIIMFQRGQKRGRTATAFNRFAEGVACAAFQVGGCTVFGLHFEEPAPPGELQGRGSEGDVVRDALDRLRAYELAQYPVKST